MHSPRNIRFALVVVLFSATTASTQTRFEPADPQQKPRLAALPVVDSANGTEAGASHRPFVTAGTRLFAVENTREQSRDAFSSRRRPAAEKVFGAVLGGIGGFFAGGYIGSKLEPDCRCDDPGLKGFLIGAPVGAIAGAIAGAALASR